MRKVILASASPRRKDLLEQAGIAFEAVPAQTEETTKETAPDRVVMALASMKALEVFDKISGNYDMTEYVVLGADTVVSCGGSILGKPKDALDARRSLEMLSGRQHEVYTGVCMIGRDENGNLFKKVFSESTQVTMRQLEDSVIDWYIKTKEPMDKAGAYGIQGKGAVLVESIRGDYNNVVGLPLASVWHCLYHLS